jgi:hypothetical protein
MDTAAFLAATYGCHATGTDLSQPFIEAARMLTERSGIADRVTFQQADALELPFAEAFFSHAWTQHPGDRGEGHLTSTIEPSIDATEAQATSASKNR